MREVLIFGMRLLGHEKFLILGRTLFLTGRTYFNFQTELTELTDFLGQKNIFLFLTQRRKGREVFGTTNGLFLFHADGADFRGI